MNIYSHIDYTLLKATTTHEDIWNLCEEAKEKGCASVCIPSCFYNIAKKIYFKTGFQLFSTVLSDYPLHNPEDFRRPVLSEVFQTPV